MSSKASTAFYAIGLSNNGRREEFTSDLGPKAAYVQDLHVTNFNRTEPDWRIVDTYGSHDQSISNRTANLMIKRGLLVEATVDQGPLAGRSLLVMSKKGVATYEALHVIPYLKDKLF